MKRKKKNMIWQEEEGECWWRCREGTIVKRPHVRITVEGWSIRTTPMGRERVPSFFFVFKPCSFDGQLRSSSHLRDSHTHPHASTYIYTISHLNLQNGKWFVYICACFCTCVCMCVCVPLCVGRLGSCSCFYICFNSSSSVQISFHFFLYAETICMRFIYR